MPWSVRRVFLLILFGFVAAGNSLVVLARHRNADVTMLAITGIAGALAIIVVSLPADGDDE
jgi:hypothetical protein